MKYGAADIDFDFISLKAYLISKGLLNAENFVDFEKNTPMYKVYKEKFSQRAFLKDDFAESYRVLNLQVSKNDPNQSANYTTLDMQFIGTPIQDLLRSLPTGACRLRLTWLAPGAQIPFHKDAEKTEESYNVHIPLTTNQNNFVELDLDGEIKKIQFIEFQPIFFNIGISHRVVNEGLFERIHLIFNIKPRELENKNFFKNLPQAIVGAKCPS